MLHCNSIVIMEYVQYVIVESEEKPTESTYTEYRAAECQSASDNLMITITVTVDFRSASLHQQTHF